MKNFNSVIRTFISRPPNNKLKTVKRSKTLMVCHSSTGKGNASDSLVDNGGCLRVSLPQKSQLFIRPKSLMFSSHGDPCSLSWSSHCHRHRYGDGYLSKTGWTAPRRTHAGKCRGFISDKEKGAFRTEKLASVLVYPNFTIFKTKSIFPTKLWNLFFCVLLIILFIHIHPWCRIF